MSQYIQGVVDYVPMIQPFQPDFNFFSNVLQLKESEYKAGYDKLSSLYGTLLNSPMSREDNIALRNTFFNDISGQIKKISSLDLSKSQNVEAAHKVFQPLIDNDFILKDISYTKTAYNELEKGQSLRNCTDPKKCRGQYWDGGARLIQYNIENFKKAKRENTLNMANPRFVPKINVSKEAIAYAKEMGLKITLPSYSPDGRYILHTTNGPAMIPDLAETFMSVFGQDPEVAQYYSALSELNRNDFINDQSNLEKYGSQDAAEMYYLDETHKKIVDAAAQILKESQEKEVLASNKRSTIDAHIKARGVDPNDPNDKKLIDARYQTLVDEMISASNAETQETNLNAVTTDDFGTLDINAKRFRIDNTAASLLLQEDLYKAADNYAMTTMDVKSEVNQYALKEYDNALALSRMASQHQYDLKLEDQKLKNEKEKIKTQALYDVFKQTYKTKNGSTPDGANPNNPGWLGVGPSPGGSVEDPNLKMSDTKVMMDASSAVQSSASDLIAKTYATLKGIIDLKDGDVLPSGAVMDNDVRNYYKGKLKELLGTSVKQTSEGTTIGGESFFDLMWNTVSNAFSALSGETSSLPYKDVTVTYSGGYLDDDGKLLYTADGSLGKSISDHKDFYDTKSQYSWENTAKRISEFFKNDPIGRLAYKSQIDPTTGQPQKSGIEAALSDYGLRELNYNNRTKNQSSNNNIVSTAVMTSDAKLPILDQLSSYPTILESDSFTEKYFGIDAPQQIVDWTMQNLLNISATGNIMTLDQFRNRYAGSKEARAIAENVVQTVYNTKPGTEEGLPIIGRRGYEGAVEEILGIMEGDAEDLYAEYMTQFQYIYNQSPKAAVKDLDKKGFVPLSNFVEFDDAGSGVQADVIRATVDPAFPGDMQAGDFRNFYDNLIIPNQGKENSGLTIYSGLGRDLTERRLFSDDPDAVDNNDGAFTALQALRMQLNETRDVEDKTRGIFDMYLHPIILNDQSKMAFSFSVSPEFTDAHMGTKGQKFMGKTNREFTIVVDKNTIPEADQLELVKRLGQGPYTIAMKADKKIHLNDFPLGGDLTILPMQNGGYVSSGTINYIDDDLNVRKYDHTAFMGSRESLENFAQRQNAMLAQNNMNVSQAVEQIKALSTNLIKDPTTFDNN